MSFSGTVTLSYPSTGRLVGVDLVANGDFLLRYVVKDPNGNQKPVTALVKADGSGIFNAAGVAVVAAGQYTGFLTQLQGVNSAFDAGLQAAAAAGQPVF